MVAEEVTVCLSGGAPWGFRLQGGAEHQKPLQVAKVRRRSKACRAGLKEDDELVAIEEQPCTELSHAQAMNLIDMQSSTLHLKVKRGSSLSPLSPPAVALLPSWGPRCITSPPDSEAYYGETDSDADTQTPTLHRMRPRRTPPHPRSPARHDSQEADTETSEMSGYESAPDGGVSMQGHAWEQGPHHAALTNGTSLLPGVPRREVVYQPPQNHEEEWGVTSSSAHTPHTPTPGDQAGALLPGEGEGEEHDSGFQEAGAYVVASAVPLVSPERANEARMLGSASQLVPMVGPQHGPVSDELSTTYREKARQAKLQRGESVVEKQVKEARTKCRSIASLLTDAPNPNSKGVLMFKKRRQRAKKYTLTCFGKAEGLDAGTETEGETGTETEEEGGSSFLSGSEVDEDGFSAGFDSTWDTGYLETLDRRSSACPSSSTPATPTTNHGLGLDTSSSAYQSPGFAHLSPGSEYAAGVDGSSWAHPGLRSSEATTNGWDQPVGGAGPYRNNNPAPMSPPAVSMYNGGPSVAVARANVILSPPASTAPPEHSEPHQNHYPGPANPAATNPDLDYPGGNLNRTARPFTPGPAGLSRSSVAPVLFRPPQPRPASAAAGGVTAATSRPAAAVSMVNMTPPPRQQQPQESRRAVSSASLYISPRNGHGGSSVYSPPASLASAPTFSHPPANNNPQPFPPEQLAAQAAPFSPPPAPHAQPLSPTTQGPPAYPSPAQAFTPHPPASSGMYAPPAPPPSQPPAAPAQAYAPAPQQAYAPAPQQAYTPAPQQAYAPAPQQAYTPAPQQAYAPAPQQAYTPAPQQAYAPAPQQAYAPAPQQAYVPAPQPGPSHPPPPQLFNPYANMAAPPPANQQPPPTAASSDSLASREQRVSVPASRTGILAEARRRSQQKKPMFCSVQNKDISPNPALLSMLQNMDRDSPPPTCPASFANVNGHNNGLNNANNASEAGHDSGPEDDWLRLGAEACNFMQAQKGPRPPPVAPKPHQAPQPAPPPPPQLGGKGGQLFARRQSRMDRYERSPSVASVAPPYSPAQPRDASPTPSLPGAWKYNSTCRAPPPINYNPLLSPSCPLKAQKTPQQKTAAAAKAAPGKGKGKNGGISAVDIMSHQPYQLNASLFTYGGGVPQNTAAPSQAPPGAKTARVREVRRFSTPPPTSTGPSLKVIAPRSATTLGEPLWRSNDDDSHAHPAPAPAPYQAYQPQVSAAAPYQPQPQWGPSASTPLSPPPPAPTAPLPQLPTFSYPGPPTFTHLQQATDARQFKSSPDLSPLVLNSAPSRPGSSMGVPRVPRPRFSTSNLGLQPCVWRPGSNMN